MNYTERLTDLQIITLARAVVSGHKKCHSRGYKDNYFACDHCHEIWTDNVTKIKHKDNCPVIFASKFLQA